MIKSLSFTGFYGNSNTGDDAFCIVSDWGARKFWQANKVRFLAANLPVRLDGSKLTSAFALPKSYFKYQNVIELALGGVLSPHIIYSGGSLFHSEIRGLAKANIFKKINLRHSLKLSAIGVSLGPYKSEAARRDIKEYLKRFSYLSLRDRRSYEDAIDMNLGIPVIQSFDLAALLPEICTIATSKNNNNPVLGISVCFYERFVKGELIKENERIKKIATVVNLLLAKNTNLKIKIFVFNGHKIIGDAAASKNLIEQINTANIEVINYSRNTLSIFKEIGSCNAVLSIRLHAGIFACFANVPFLQVEYHRKCTDLLDDMDYATRYRIGDFEVSPVEATKILEDMLFSSSQRGVDTEALTKRALLNFTSYPV